MLKTMLKNLRNLKHKIELQQDAGMYQARHLLLDRPKPNRVLVPSIFFTMCISFYWQAKVTHDIIW